MKKYTIIIMFIFALTNCIKKSEKEILRMNSSVFNKLFISFSILYPVNDIFLKELKDFIDHCDSLFNKETQVIKENVIIVKITNYKSNCYLQFNTAYYYDLNKMIGYFIHNNKMIVFYKIDELCNAKFVKKELLIKRKNLNFDEKGEANIIIFEPYGRLYKIIDSDSLIFLKQSIRLTLENYFGLYK